MSKKEWIKITPDGPRPKSNYVWVFDGDYCLLWPNVEDYFKWDLYSHYMEAEIEEPEKPAEGLT